jgi:hypothetical protein
MIAQSDQRVVEVIFGHGSLRAAAPYDQSCLKQLLATQWLVSQSHGRDPSFRGCGDGAEQPSCSGINP